MLIYDFLHYPTSGQSLAIGGMTTGLALSLVCEEPNVVVVATDGTTSPLQVPPTAAQRPDLSMGYTLARYAPTQQIGMSTHGQGGQTIADLSKGGATGKYEEAIATITAAHAAYSAAGHTYAVPSVHWIQGEADQGAGTSIPDYVTALNSLFSDYKTDITAITGQALPVTFILSQTATWAYSVAPEARIGLAQLEAARTIPGMYMACAQYQFPYIDPYHLQPQGYYYLGELHARAQNAINTGAGWDPFAPINYTVAIDHVDVQYHVPVGSLQFDTTTVPARTNMGFSLAGTAASILSVNIISPDTIRLNVSRPITETGAQVGYGVKYSNGRQGQGNLCDSETAVSHYDGAHIANWALHSLDEIQPVAITPLLRINQMYWIINGQRHIVSGLQQVS